jgi:hypothetical protein
LLDQRKESIIVPIYRKGDKTDCNNYRGISPLSTSYKILSNILLSRLSPYIDEVIGDHQRGFRRNRSTTDQIFCIRQILEKRWEYNETVHQLFVDLKKAYDSIRREVLYNILIENRVLRRIFGPKTVEVTGGWRKLHNEELHNLYSSPGIIRMIKSTRMRWVGHVARMGRRGMHIGYWWESQRESRWLTLVPRSRIFLP